MRRRDRSTFIMLQQVEERGLKSEAARCRPPLQPRPRAAAAGAPAEGRLSPVSRRGCPSSDKAGEGPQAAVGPGDPLPPRKRYGGTDPAETGAPTPRPALPHPGQVKPGLRRTRTGSDPAPPGRPGDGGTRRLYPPRHCAADPPPSPAPRQRDAAPHPGNGTGAVPGSAAPEAELAPNRKREGAGSARRPQPPGSAAGFPLGGRRRRRGSAGRPAAAAPASASRSGRCLSRRARSPLTEPCWGGRGDPACSGTGQAVRRGRGFTSLTRTALPA